MWATGRWKDKQYASCVFAGARCKQQRLRHNLAEIDSWPILACHHTHAANEWEPWLRNGVRVYPSARGSRIYSAAVICDSGRSVVVGMSYGEGDSPSLGPQQWNALDAGSIGWIWTGAWTCAMAPLAITLGLEPPDPAERKRVPRRVRVTDVLSSEGALAKDTIYVGRGHHSHRLPTTKWKSPWTPGHDCSHHDEWLILYVDYICHGSLWDQLHELQGHDLAYDCVWQDLCEADMLAGLAFEASTPVAAELPSQAIGRQSSAASLRKVVFASALHQARSSTLPRNVVLRSQESVILCFQKLFPADWFLGFKFPMIEDLVNQPPFNDFPQWLSAQDVPWMPWDGPLGPQHAPRSVRLAQRMTEAQQSGALAHRAALPPLLPFGLDVDEHFRLTRRRAAQPMPTEGASVLDPDLHFAAWQGSRLRGSLRQYRQKAVGMLSELASRWRGVTTHLRGIQPQSVAAVTASRDIGLVALLMVVLQWPDVTYTHTGSFWDCQRWGLHRAMVFSLSWRSLVPLLRKFSATGNLIMPLFCRICGPVRMMNSSSSNPWTHQGFCTEPMTRAQLLSTLKGAPHRLIPRCVITQSSGKQRIIDDAAKGGQSDSSSDSNKLVLCSPLRPAQHAQALLHLSSAELLQCREGDSLESGGEDWPNAYRHSPMGVRESHGCVVTFWHHGWGQPAFQIYAGLLFGLPLAVTSFNRYSKFVEACGRRLGSVLVSMYFDDATITDWASSKGSGQFTFGRINQLLGTPFADEKRQAMQASGAFLGLEHDFSSCLLTGAVSFWAKDKLISKLLGIIQESHRSSSLPPGVAAKLYGLANFFEQGVFGRIGCGGL